MGGGLSLATGGYFHMAARSSIHCAFTVNRRGTGGEAPGAFLHKGATQLRPSSYETHGVLGHRISTYVTPALDVHLLSRDMKNSPPSDTKYSPLA